MCSWSRRQTLFSTWFFQGASLTELAWEKPAMYAGGLARPPTLIQGSRGSRGQDPASPWDGLDSSVYVHPAFPDSQ